MKGYLAPLVAIISLPLCNGFSLETTNAPSNVYTHTFSRQDAFGTPLESQVTQISQDPPMLVLKNFVSVAERQALMWNARNTPPAYIYDAQGNLQNNRVGSTVIWLPHSDPISKALASSAADLLLGSKGGIHEELQVVQYEAQGEFQLHHDAQDRLLTVLYYLNGVAGTWFPLASGMSEDINHERATNEQEAKCLAKEREPGQHGMLAAGNLRATDNIVPIHPGDALVFYSYNQEGEQDWMALHAGLPATEEKWIATHWFHEKK